MNLLFIFPEKLFPENIIEISTTKHSKIPLVNPHPKSALQTVKPTQSNSIHDKKNSLKL